MSGSSGTGGFLDQPPKRRSRWLWWVYLGFGMVSFVGFIIVAVKVQTPKFVRAAVVSVVACVVGLAPYVIWPPIEEVSQNTSSESSTDLGTVSTSTWIIMGIWIGLIVYGHVLNRDYKEILRDKDDQDYGSSLAPGPRAPSAPPVDVLGVEADRYFATQPPGNAPAAVPPNAPGA